MKYFYDICHDVMKCHKGKLIKQY